MSQNTKISCRYDSNCIALNNTIRHIHTLVLRSFQISESQVCLIENENVLIFSSNTDQKRVIYEDTFYAQSFLTKEIDTTENLMLPLYAELGSFYASVPLFTNSRHIFGSVVLIDDMGRAFTTQQFELLSTLSATIALLLTQHHELRQMKHVFTDYIHKTVHDLKNPLTSVSLTAELMRRKADDAEVVKRFSARIESSNAKVFTVLEEIRQSFPIEGNGFKLAVKEIKVADLLADLTQAFPESSVATEHYISETIFADYDRLKESVAILMRCLRLNGDDNQSFMLKAHREQNTLFIQVSANCKGAERDVTLNPLENIDLLATARTLIALQKGSLTYAYDDKFNTDSFTVSLPSFIG